MLKYNFFLYGIMGAIGSLGFFANYSMDITTESALNKKNSMTLHSLMKQHQNTSLPHITEPQQSLVNIKKEHIKNNSLFFAFSAIVQTSSQLAVAYTAAVQAAFNEKIGKNESMKKLSAKELKELNEMSVEKKRLALGLTQLKSDGTFVVTNDECNTIAAMPPAVKAIFKDVTVIVPASTTNIALRVAGEVGCAVLPGIITGALVNSRIAAQENNRRAQELYEQNKAIVYESTYKQVFEESYVENFKDQIDKVITQDGCLTGLLAEFIIGTTNKNNVDEIGLSYGRKLKQRIGSGSFNLLGAFHEASIEECQKRLDPAIRERTSVIASTAAKTAADLTIQNLKEPVSELLSLNSGIKNGPSWELITFSAITGLMTSWFKGDFTRPIVHKKIGNL